MPLSNAMEKLLDALGSFAAHPHAHFNFSKFAAQLGLDPTEEEQLLNLTFRLQTLFCEQLEGYYLGKLTRNTTIYLNLIKKSIIPKKECLDIHEIYIDKAHSHLLSDIVYYFEHVKIGKGFDLHQNGSELLSKVNKLNKKHPYFFEHRGNGLLYPTQLALAIGKQLLFYLRSNKELDHLIIDNHVIKII